MADRLPTTPTPVRRRHTRAGPAALDRRPGPTSAIIPAGPPIPITVADRARIESDIELLIDFLDVIDAPTNDLELDDDDGCVAEDRPIEGLFGLGDFDDGEDGGDDEPSLGWTALGMNGAPGQNAGTLDLEDATADAEPDFDAEPVCGPHTPDGGMLGGVADPGDPLAEATL